jgi:radical SAM-linked protein
MSDHRLLFSKEGRARYISHLDLMRTFQRAFFRAGIQIRHTEGFHPHAFISIALPLSLGYSSQCEILEFGLLGGAELDQVPALLNQVLPEGVTVHQCYQGGQPIKKLAYLNYRVSMEYENGVPDGTEQALGELLGRESLVVRKKSKKAKAGYTEVDIIPRLRSWTLERGEGALVLDAVLAAQNPGLNPELICAALREAYPQLAPDFVAFHRREALDENLGVFR